jgi:hypothetical protein
MSVSRRSTITNRKCQMQAYLNLKSQSMNDKCRRNERLQSERNRAWIAAAAHENPGMRCSRAVVSKWMAKLNLSCMSRRRQTRHIKRNKLKRFSSVQTASHGPEGSQAAVRTTIKWHLMKKCQINRSREVRHHLPHRPLFRSRWECQIGPQGRRACFKVCRACFSAEPVAPRG